MVACGAVRKVRGPLRKHVGYNAHENCVFCSCTPEIYKPPQQASSPYISRGYTAQQNSQPVSSNTIRAVIFSLRRNAPLVVPFCHRLHEPTRSGHAQACHHDLSAKGSPNPWVQAPRTSRHTRDHHKGGGTREHRAACHRHQLPWAMWRSSRVDMFRHPALPQVRLFSFPIARVSS